MKPVLTPQQAVELDRAAQAAGVAADQLMERAGRAVARAAVDLVGGTYGRRAVVVCGKGNNGGDGLVAARHLDRWGMRVSVHLLEAAAELREPAATNARRVASESEARLRAFSPAALERDLRRTDVAIDAIFGTGFRGVPEDEWAEAIASLDAGDAPIIAVDTPSGVNGSNGDAAGPAIRAELTVTFGAAKTGVVLLPGAEYAGAVRVVDIGYPEGLVRADAFLTEPADVVAALPVRAIDTHKRESGVLLVVAGSRAMTGAPRLIARAAGRIGAGLVMVAAPVSALPAIQAGLTEAVFVPLPETESGTAAEAALEPVLGALERAHALAIGPGLSTDASTASLVRAIVGRSQVPSAVDADALTAFTGDAAALAERRADAVLTPHAGEFARLTGVKPGDLETDRLGHTRRLAQTAGAVALVKGSRTTIADPSGDVRINPTGSPFLATAGSGDVLTGMIGGLLARGVPALDAAAAAAYLHGTAGLLAGAAEGEGAMAGDLAERIPDAVEQVVASP
jgi:ADP-dependent NAD(P)H-hydrate dehydratase / NAD(P)H-hydrate epimerase